MKTPDEIQLHVKYFLNLATKTDQKSKKRMLAEGARLFKDRDELAERLELGWDYLEQHPDNIAASDLWFAILESYEQICDALDANIPDRVDAARAIFNGIEHDERRED